jgi:hypothetical protein
MFSNFMAREAGTASTESSREPEKWFDQSLSETVN